MRCCAEIKRRALIDLTDLLNDYFIALGFGFVSAIASNSNINLNRLLSFRLFFVNKITNVLHYAQFTVAF